MTLSCIHCEYEPDGETTEGKKLLMREHHMKEHPRREFDPEWYRQTECMYCDQELSEREEAVKHHLTQHSDYRYDPTWYEFPEDFPEDSE